MIDPFEVKRFPKIHPYRLLYTLRARGQEWLARHQFEANALPLIDPGTATGSPAYDAANTAVTPVQMEYLLQSLRSTEELGETVVVEIGSYRGETTRLFAMCTNRTVIAVDPFIGYGGSSSDLEIFRERTRGLNVVHERKTSGQAVREWRRPSPGFVFIDAVHNYVNTAFDIAAWSALMKQGGALALHDTDNRSFAGTRRAAKELCGTAELMIHVEDLAVFRVQRAVGNRI
ncbi:MAG: class I SAM-dependent methyltransferase [Bryobacteraceae bacterium]|jgi:hypothetical protein